MKKKTRINDSGFFSASKTAARGQIYLFCGAAADAEKEPEANLFLSFPFSQFFSYSFRIMISMTSRGFTLALIFRTASVPLISSQSVLYSGNEPASRYAASS